MAPRISVSRLSPIIRLSASEAPAISKANLKISGSGFIRSDNLIEIVQQSTTFQLNLLNIFEAIA